MDGPDDRDGPYDQYRLNFFDVPDDLDGFVQVVKPVRVVRPLLVIGPVRVVVHVRIVRLF